MVLHRRQFLATGLMFAATLALPLRQALASRHRSLSLKNLQTGEKLNIVYWADGTHIGSACRQIDWILRDHWSGEVAPIAPQLLDLLYVLRTSLHTEGPFEVASAYRSSKTNAALAKKSVGVARNSLHTRGMAVDIQVPGCPLARVRNQAVALKLGGVGYYPKGGFVHVDVGRVRHW